MILLSNIFRYFLTFLSFPYNLKNEKLNKNQIRLIKELKEKKLTNKNNKLTTHKIFSSALGKIIKQGNLENFLRYGFIQKMFFVHNRFYNYKFLKNIYLSKKKNWLNLLEENSVGNPVPFFLNKKTSGNRIRNIYLTKKILDYGNISKIDAVIEIGGGYGCVASIFYKINKNINYTIFDLPEVNMLQYYYLNSLGIKCSLENQSAFTLTSQILTLKKKLSQLKKKNYKIITIANWSLSEMPISLRNNLKFLFSHCDYGQISFQSKFESISNKKYFFNFERELRENYLSQLKEINEMNNIFNKNKHYILQIKKK